MTESPGDDGADRPRHEMSGSADDVVQARDIAGGVHFHSTSSAGPAPRPRQLPADVREFVNRQDDLERLDVLLPGRASTLAVACAIVGTAGVGKTSLVVHWAHAVADQFPDGQLYINLQGYDPGPPVTAEQALDRFLRALGVPADAIPADLAARSAMFRTLLAGRRTLIVLDNAVSVAQVRPLLPGTAGCLVLITSRSRLAGLVARDGAFRISLDVLSDAEAAELLRRVTEGFRPPDEPGEIEELARLCARLPLALRIAAERAGSRPWMPLRRLIEDLRDESSLWDALATEQDDDLAAVRTVFAWSYRALPEPAGHLFRLLGLHPGPSFGTAAVAALAGTSTARAGRLLDDLVGAYLLDEIGPDRYQFHDLLRAYAVEQARSLPDDDRAAAGRRLLLWYLHAADAAVAATLPQGRRPRLPPAEDVTPPRFTSYEEADGWLDRERANLVGAVRAAADAEFHDIAWLIPAVLRAPYARRNQFDDWVTTGTIGLGAARRLADRAAEAEILTSLGKAHVQAADIETGVGFHLSALAIREDLGDRAGQLDSVNAAGLASLRAHRLPEALALFRQASDLADALADPYWTGVSANNIANVHLEFEEFPEAERLLLGALETYRRLGDLVCEGDCLHGLSRAYRGLDRPDDAFTSISRALEIARSNRYRVAEALWSVELGRVQVALGRPDDALDSYRRAAAMHRQIGDRSREATAFDATGLAYHALGRYDEAVDFHRLAAGTFRELDDRWRLAVALVNLSAALQRSGSPAAAERALREATSRVADFADPAAHHLRNRIAELRDRA